jgi:predicted DsbA family dithiol-disulfide isomerase
MAQPVTITAWIDFLDPWSWVTTTRLERLSARYGDLVELEWRAFMRYPEKQVRDLDEWRKATVEWLEPAAAEPGLGFSMWATTNAPPTHSAPALAAALVAGEEDAERAPSYWRALFRAHFTENRTISDGGTLIAIAREVGIDEDGFAMGLRGRYTHYVKQVIEEHNAGAKRGVTATPAVVIGDEYLVRGAASDEQYRDLIDQVLEARGVTPPAAPEPAAEPAPESAAEPAPEPAPEPATEPAPAPASGSGVTAPAESEVAPAGAEHAPVAPSPPTPESEVPAPAPASESGAEPTATPEGPAATDAPVAAPSEPVATAQPASEPTATSTDESEPAPAAKAPAKAPAKKTAAKKKSPAKKKAPARKQAAKKAPAKRSRAKKAPARPPAATTDGPPPSDTSAGSATAESSSANN